MKVEVVNCGNETPKDNETAYWVATILKVNVNLMLLRYEGYEDDGVDDFWFDVRSKNIHPVGWCYSVQKLLIPPPGNQITFSSIPGTACVADAMSNQVTSKIYRNSPVVDCSFCAR